MENNKVSVTINGRMYTLVSEETTEYMRELSDYVNKNVQKVKDKNPALMGERPIVLAALNICDELFKENMGGKVMFEKAQKNYDEIIAENKRLRERLNDTDVSGLKRQLESARAEIERLRRYNR